MYLTFNCSGHKNNDYLEKIILKSRVYKKKPFSVIILFLVEIVVVEFPEEFLDDA